MPQSYQLVYTPEALEGISKLPGNLKRIAERVLVQIAVNPQAGKRLSGKFKGIHSERVTRRYRILYLVKHSDRQIVVLDVRHRREAYE